MRAVSACVLVLLGCATLAAAQGACVAPASNPFDTTQVTGCAALTACQTTFNTCATNAGCADWTKCAQTYLTCTLALTSTRNTTSNCSVFGNTLYMATLAAVMSPSLNGTALQAGCNFWVCRQQNISAPANCGNISGNICTSAVLLAGTTTTTAPVTAVVTTRGPAIVVSIRLSGGNWSAVLADPVKKAQAIAALTTDIAKLLGVDSKYVQIISLTIASLVVDFQILDGSGKSPAALQSLVATAQGSSAWLGSTATVYATVGTDAITTLAVTVTATAAPTTVAPGSTPKSSAMSAAGVWAVAMIAAVAALLA